MSETVDLRFDPRRPQVHGVMAAAINGQDVSLPEQAIADAMMGMLVLGEAMNIDGEDQYLAMIRAALPNARKAASNI